MSDVGDEMKHVQGSPHTTHRTCSGACSNVDTDSVARVFAMQASKIRRDATVSAEETGGFKYVPGGREYHLSAWPREIKQRSG
jgi:hypothetical protein